MEFQPQGNGSSPLCNKIFHKFIQIITGTSGHSFIPVFGPQIGSTYIGLHQAAWTPWCRFDSYYYLLTDLVENLLLYRKKLRKLQFCQFVGLDLMVQQGCFIPIFICWQKSWFLLFWHFGKSQVVFWLLQFTTRTILLIVMTVMSKWQ